MMSTYRILDRSEDMYINYTTQEVMRKVTEEVVASFTFSITLPVEVIKELIERHFSSKLGGRPYSGFNKIGAIKELRNHTIGFLDYDYKALGPRPVLGLGLREAKDIIEAVYREGIDAGNYLDDFPNSLISTIDKELIKPMDNST